MKYRFQILFTFLLLLPFSFSYGALTPLDPEPIHEAFVSKYSEARNPAIRGKQPPAPIIEKQPAQPYSDMVWIPGYWTWDDAKSDYSWICGVWRRSPPNHTWISGSWEKNQGGWSWAKGFWSKVPEEKLTLIESRPPAAIDDKVPAMPGEGYFWVPGYWNYSKDTKKYAWLSGKWEKLNEKWILTPSCYAWRPNGYYFAPLYWDWTLDERGTAYSCSKTDGTDFVVLQPDTIMKELFLCYPDFIVLYCHWGHYHPEWWDGCWCLPPWWNWGGWWTLPWGDQWCLWWWWGHPGSFPPFWLTLELSRDLFPPPVEMIEFFKKISKPHFEVKLGDKPLLPQGHPHGDEPARPHIPNDVTPQGQITLPTYPEDKGDRVVTPPVPDVLPQPEVKPLPEDSHPSYTQPYYPSYQPPTGYPQDQPQFPIEPINPPTYYPPNNPPMPPRRPPYYPPRKPPSDHGPNYPDHKPSDDWHPKFPSDNQPPSRTQPPSGNAPNYPKYNPSSNWNSPSNQPPSRMQQPSSPSPNSPSYNPSSSGNKGRNPQASSSNQEENDSVAVLPAGRTARNPNYFNPNVRNPNVNPDFNPNINRPITPRIPYQ